MFDQAFGRFLVGAAEIGVEPHLPSAAGKKRRLHDVMAEDVAAEGWRPVKLGQAAAGRPGPAAHDRIVAPEGSGTALQPREPAREDRRVEPRRELHRPTEDRPGTHHDRQRLQQAEPWLRLHAPDHLDDGPGGHQAVRIEDERVIVGRAAAAEEIGDIAGLAPGVLGAAAVEETVFRPRLRHEAGEPERLARDRFGLPAVREDREVNLRRRILQRFVHRGHAGEGRCRILVADRHEDHRPAGDGARRLRNARRGPEPDQRQPRAPGQPGGRQRQKNRAEIGVGRQPRRRGILEEKRRRAAACQERQGDGEGPQQGEVSVARHVSASRYVRHR